MNWLVLKNIAKSDRFQMVYARTKEIGSLKLFENTTDLTRIQVLFLYYLELYASLYRDLASKEPYITEEVINNDLRTEAYVLWRSECKETEMNKKTKVNSNQQQIDYSSDTPTLLFNKRGQVK